MHRGCAFSLLTFLAVWAGVVSSTSAVGGESESPVLSRMEIAPDRLHLSGKNRQRQLLVTGYRADGSPFDLTHSAHYVAADRGMVTIDGGLVRGLTEGQTTLRVSAGRLHAEVSVTVSDFSNYPAVDFRGDVLPLLSKHGCNSGGCHGRQSGQNGFKLSVFGFDPVADYDALVHEGRGRRIFPGAVRHSLVYAKAVGLTSHGGGQRMTEDSQDAELLREWLRQGAPWGRDSAPVLTGVTVRPSLRIMPPKSGQQLQVTATYSDGRTRDVTRAADYSGNQPSIADCTDSGLIQTGTAAGEAAVTVNYMGMVDVSRVVIPQSEPEPARPQWLTSGNRIDEFVWQKWKQLRIPPSPLCDDATFLRRVRVKVSGTLPKADEVRRFLMDESPNKRAVLVERVLASDEFVSYWTQRWSDILMVNSKAIGGRGAYAFHRWIRKQIRDNRPYDQWVREIVTASGNTGQVGPANFFRLLRTPEDVTKTISQAFLGVRMDCAQCHHHPFEKWGQDDFYGLAGYFNGLSRVKLDDNRELILHPGHKSISIPVIQRSVDTRPPGGTATLADKATDPRPELARWMTSPKNPYFARLVSNRLWKHLMGRGLVEAEDDFRETNPPTNPQLLDHLAGITTESGFNLKELMRQILLSHVFQLSSRATPANHGDQQFYSHYPVRRLPAEVMLDAICQVTGTPERYVGHPTGTRAIELWDNQMPSYFLDTFGRSLRQSPCECGSSGEPTMAQALHLLNAPEIEAKVQSLSGNAVALAESDLSTDELIQQVALMTVNRMPNDSEIAVGRRLLSSSSRTPGTQDLMWVMLNAYDFLFVK